MINRHICSFCALVLLLVCCACGTRQKETISASSSPEAVISKDTATLIARRDAFHDYDLSEYDVRVEEQPSAWKVVFKLKDRNRFGGGPEYQIDKKTGKILHVAYYK